MARPADHFWGRGTSAKAFTTRFLSEFGELDAGTLPTLADEGQLLIPVPADTVVPEGHPRYYAARFDKILALDVQTKIVCCWDRLLAAGVKFPKPDPNRSGSPALHLGIWELYMNLPKVSSDTWDQEEGVITVMDELFLMLRRYVVPKMKNLMRRYYPSQFQMCER